MSRARLIARYAAWAGFALFLVAVWAAPMRAVFRVGIVAATLVALLPAALTLGALAWRTSFVWPSRRWLLVIGAFALCAIALMWNRRFGPLVGWIGSDGGVHISYRDRFIDNDPTIYESFVGFYGFTWWIERVFHTDAFWSFGASFLIITALVAGLSAFTIARASALADSASTRVTRISDGSALAVAGAVLVVVSLPLLSYYQADGFFAQLWGIVPLLAFWLADLSGLDRVRRFVLLALSVILVRYTYGLVLGDLFVVLPVLMLIEAVAAWRRREPGRVWWVLATLAACVGCAVALRLFIGTMQGVLPRYGWFINHDYKAVLLGAAIVAGALAVCSACAPTLGRLIAVPVVAGISNCALSYYLGAHATQHYYLYKYNFHALILLGLALPAAVVYLARSRTTRAAPRWIARGALLLAAVGVFQVARGVEPMRVLFRERAFNYQPTALEALNKLHVGPLVDLGAVLRIREQLRQEHAAFGGLLISSGPMFNFMNAEFGRYGDGFFAFKRLDESDGHCVFWSEKGGRGWAWPLSDWMKAKIEALKRDPSAVCRAYHASWDATLERELCGVCRVKPANQPR